MNLIGQQFGRLVVIGPSERRGPKGHRIYWPCRCDCGIEKYVSQGSLRNGNTRSCGCLRREVVGQRHTKHGMYGTLEYHSWQAMKRRCHAPKVDSYKYYGERGISICTRWRNSFQNFYDDMGPIPGPTYSIERIDNDGNYAPGNCRWATTKEQGRNMRTNRMLTYNGKTLCLVEWSEITGIGATTISERLKRDWSIEEALIIPVLRRKRYLHGRKPYKRHVTS